MKYDSQRNMVPDDWRRLPSGLYVKVWTEADLSPEVRQIVVNVVHSLADELGWALEITRARRSGQPSLN